MYTPPLAVDVSVVDDVHTIVGAVLVVLVLPGLLVGVMLLVSVLPQPLLVPPMFPLRSLHKGPRSAPLCRPLRLTTCMPWASNCGWSEVGVPWSGLMTCRRPLSWLGSWVCLWTWP